MVYPKNVLMSGEFVSRIVGSAVVVVLCVAVVLEAGRVSEDTGGVY